MGYFSKQLGDRLLGKRFNDIALRYTVITVQHCSMIIFVCIYSKLYVHYLERSSYSQLMFLSFFCVRFLKLFGSWSKHVCSGWKTYDWHILFKFLSTHWLNNPFLVVWDEYSSVTKRCAIVWVVPPPNNSHHQDYYVFSRRSQPKPSFATVTGRGDNPSHSLKTPLFLCFFITRLFRDYQIGDDWIWWMVY